MKIDNEAKAYLTFSLGAEKFAILVDNVQEIIELDRVTKVPNTPPYMLGIINLRGKVLPLLDSRLKLGLSQAEITKKSRIMVLDIETAEGKGFQIGALVDIAKDVILLGNDDIQDAPDFENNKAQVPVTGVVNNQGDITMIIDINRIFSNSEILTLEQTLN